MNKIINQRSLSWLHPLVRDWFVTNLGSPTEPQIKGWPKLRARMSTLISAPTGSGKTLTAFLPFLDQLVRESLDSGLEDRTQIIYVSPLKALSNDIEKNLKEPLRQIAELAKSKSLEMKEIRVGLRTGDTPMAARRNLVKHPPHILVTTPETLYLLLTAEKSREAIRTCHTVIVDEIHALARDKRGVHLSLSLERLEALCEKPLLRIGLSATQKPLELVAKFLVGNREMPAIIDSGHKRQRDLAIVVPTVELGAVATHEIWDDIYEQLAKLATTHRSTLIFTNTRRLAERIAHQLRERLGENVVSAHHGSLSKTLRLDVENKLKAGKLKALVATASLELGIDIGELDLVCQIGSPRSIAVALQRVGRAGHFHTGISRGRFFATTRDELLECAALLRSIKNNELDALIMPKESLDILAQQIVAIIASESMHEDKLFSLVSSAFPYRDLTKDVFLQVINMLAEGVSGLRGRYGALLIRDRVNNIISARRNSRLTAILNGGAIVDNGLFIVVDENNKVLGSLDEDFAVESSRGDVILLGTTSWRVQRVEANSGKVVVENAHGEAPSIPFWRGEAPGRTKELSENVGRLRYDIDERLPRDIDGENLPSCEAFRAAMQWLKAECFLGDDGATQLLMHIFAGRSILGAVPTTEHIIAERFFDEAGGMQLVIHSPFGARINKAWGLALRKCFCRSFNYELQASATDDGINIALLEQHSFPLSDVFSFLHPNSVKKVLTQALLQSPLFPTRFRFTSTRGLALPKFRGGKKMPPNIARILADDLLASVFPDAAACQDNLGGKDLVVPDHPLVNEAMKEIFTDPLDLEGFADLLLRITDGRIKTSAIDTITPSVFSHEILNANPYAFLDEAPLEERRARAVAMRTILPQKLDDLALLDEDAINLVKQQSVPDIRNKNELHDTLVSLIAMPMAMFSDEMSEWGRYLLELIAEHRVSIAALPGGQQFAVAAERKKMFLAIYQDAVFQKQLIDLDDLSSPTKEEAVAHMIKHYMYTLGPTTNRDLASLLILTEQEIDAALLKLESIGLILRGHFRKEIQETEWCERRLLARIHRLTLDRLRKEIEPASKAQFQSWLHSWQGLTKDTQRVHEEGLLDVIRQLQGFELPANQWEEFIFKPRVRDYKPEMLDYLGLKGRIIWGRFSPHSALDDEESRRAIIPRSTAPITFFIRDEMGFARRKKQNLNGLSSVAQFIYALLQERGALFFSDIHQRVGGLAFSVETALWQLIVAGLITSDDFSNMRILLHAKLRNSRRQRVRFNTGRFFVLNFDDAIADDEEYLSSCARVLLYRYGIVFRDVVAREKTMPSFFMLQNIFRRMESRGECRGGYFIEGVAGEQFASPVAVSSLRLAQKTISLNDGLPLSPKDPVFIKFNE